MRGQWPSLIPQHNVSIKVEDFNGHMLSVCCSISSLNFDHEMEVIVSSNEASSNNHTYFFNQQHPYSKTYCCSLFRQNKEKNQLIWLNLKYQPFPHIFTSIHVCYLWNITAPFTLYSAATLEWTQAELPSSATTCNNPVNFGTGNVSSFFEVNIALTYNRFAQ